MFGIFGHGNVAGIGQALHQYADAFRFYQTRNEQSMVHTAAAFAKMSNRFACLCLYDLYRTGRDEHADRCRRRDD